MAEGITAQSVLGKMEGHLECSICFNRFREPKVLDCLHSFCLKCLQEISQCQDPQGMMLKCPLCRRKTTLKDVADLPNNFTLSALVEEVSLQEQLLEGQGSEIKCQACDEDNQAASRCTDCDHFLCQECQRAHERMAVMKSHKIYTLAQLRSGEIVYQSKLREDASKCGQHPHQHLDVYCNTCEKLLCTTCSLLHHGKHSFIDLPEALGKCKQGITELATNVEEKKKALIIATAEAERSRKRLNTMFADTTKKITQKADKEVAKIEEQIAKIRDQEWRLKEEAEELYDDTIKTFETAQANNNKEVSKAEHKLDEVNQLMAKASCYEILNLKHKLLDNLKECAGKQPERVSDALSFMDFEEGEKSLGRLVLEDKSKLVSNAASKAVESTMKLHPRVPDTQSLTVSEEEKTPRRLELEDKRKLVSNATSKAEESTMKLHPRGNWNLKTEIKKSDLKQEEESINLVGVAAFSNNEIVVLDSVNKQLIKLLPVSDCQSPVISESLDIEGVHNPHGVAVNKDDQLILLDGYFIKTFNRKYQLLHQFKTGRSLRFGLAVDDRNLIATGYQFGQHGDGISLHKPDGSLIRRLPGLMISQLTYLAMSNQRILCTNSMHGKLESVDYNGQQLFTERFNAAEVKEVRGLCCDTDGSIYVACHGYQSTGKILHFGPDGKFIENVITRCSVVNSVTFTPDGDLVVIGNDAVGIYHHM